MSTPQCYNRPMKKWQLATIVLIIILFVVFFVPIFPPNNQPPSLDLGTQGLKGYIGGNNYFFQFEQSDLERLGAFQKATARNSNIQYYYSQSDLSFKEIIASIKPDLDNQCIVITYRPQDQQFYTYPKGPFQGTKQVQETELASFIVPAADPIIIACAQATATINISHSSEQPPSFHNDLSQRPQGWQLTVFHSTEELKNSLDNCRNRLQSTWVQTGENQFEKSSTLTPGYYFAWLKLSPGTCNATTSDSATSSPAESNDGSMTIYQFLKQNYSINDNRLQGNTQ